MNNSCKDIIISQITKILQEQGKDINDIGIGEKLSDLGLDSMDMITLIINLESVFDIEFDPEDLLFEKYETVDSIVNIVGQYK